MVGNGGGQVQVANSSLKGVKMRIVQKKSVLFSVISILGLGLLSMTSRVQCAETGIEELLPANTVGLLKFSDWSQTRKDIKKTALGRIFAEEDVLEYSKGVEKVLDEMLKRLEQQTGIKPDDFEKAFGTEISVAYLGMEVPDAERRAIISSRSGAIAVRRMSWQLRRIQESFKREQVDGQPRGRFAARIEELLPISQKGKRAWERLPDDLVAALKDGKPWKGYRFSAVAKLAGKEIDYKRQFAFCATPAKYSPQCRYTVLMSSMGMVVAKDAAGQAAADFPADAHKEGWKQVYNLAGGEVPPWALAVIARIGDQAAAGRIVKVLDGLTAGIQPRYAKRILDWPGVEGVAFKTKRQNDRYDPELFSLRVGNYYVWAIARGQKQIQQLTTSLLAGKCEKSLATVADYKKVRSPMGGRPDFLFYAGIEKGLGQVLPNIPDNDRQNVKKVMEALGVFDFKSLVSSLTVEAPGFRGRSFLACDIKEKGLLGLFSTEPLPEKLLKLVPVGVVAAQAGKLHLERILPLIKAVAFAGEGERGVKHFERGLEMFKQQLNIDLEKSILGSLSGRGMLYSLPPEAAGGNPLLGPLNGLVLMLEVKDPVALRQAADLLLAMLKAEVGRGGGPAQFSEFEYRGEKVTAVSIAGMASPSLAITEKYLVIAVNAQGVKKALARIAAPGKAGPSLVDSEIYRKSMGRLKAGPACSLSYLDPRSSVSTVMASAGLVAGMVLPRLTGARDQARSVHSMMNLRQIGMGVQLWAADNKEGFPKSLNDLVPEFLADKKIFVNPRFAKHAADGIDYAYVAGMRSADPGSSVLTYEPIPDKNGNRIVGFCDAHVEKVGQKRFEKLLTAQRARLKKQDRVFTLIVPKGVARGAATATADILSADSIIKLLSQMASPATMPPAEVITKHLFPSVSKVRRVEGGIMAESFSPLGMGGGGMLKPAVGLGLGGMYFFSYQSSVRHQQRMVRMRDHQRMEVKRIKARKAQPDRPKPVPPVEVF
jgi:hypothetical protein